MYLMIVEIRPYFSTVDALLKSAVIPVGVVFRRFSLFSPPDPLRSTTIVIIIFAIVCYRFRETLKVCRREL